MKEANEVESGDYKAPRDFLIAFWIRVLGFTLLLGFVLPWLFSSKTDAGPVAGIFIAVAAITYLYNFVISKGKKA